MQQMASIYCSKQNVYVYAFTIYVTCVQEFILTKDNMCVVVLHDIINL